MTDPAPASQVEMQPVWALIENSTGHESGTTGSEEIAFSVWPSRPDVQESQFRISRLVEAGSPADLAAKDAEIARLQSALSQVVGCFDAAYSEGLAEKLSDEEDRGVGTLHDLVTRRVLFAHSTALAGLSDDISPVDCEAKGAEIAKLRDLEEIDAFRLKISHEEIEARETHVLRLTQELAAARAEAARARRDAFMVGWKDGYRFMELSEADQEELCADDMHEYLRTLATPASTENSDVR